MNHRPQTKMKAMLLWPLLALSACDTDETPPRPNEPTGERAGAEVGEGSSAECTRGLLEPDFRAGPLQGPGVVDGALAAGEYVLSTTYLELRQEPESQRKFGELMGPIMADLMKREGVVAIALGTSEQCGSARTLSIWRD